MPNPDQKYVLASPEWVEYMLEVTRELIADQPTLAYRMCEVFTEVPAELEPDADGRIAYTLEVKNGEAHLVMEESPADAVDVKATSTWAKVLPLVVIPYDSEDPEAPAMAEKLSAELIESGDLVVVANREMTEAEGIIGTKLHNRLARATAP